MAQVVHARSADTGARPLLVFFTLTFVIGWGLIALLLVFTDQIEAVLGPVSGTNPVFVLAVWSPAISALILVWRSLGFAGVRAYLARLGMWRMPALWWALLLLGIPALKYASAAINGTAGDFPFSPWYAVLPAMVVVLFVGPVEEIGWRGYALPLLQRRFTPLVASLVLGAFWGVWHLPAFLLGGTEQGGWSFGPFLLGALALSVLMTGMFNASGGSILIPVLVHFQLNGPAWPEGQPWENYVFAAAVLALVVWKRDQFLSRDRAVTGLVRRAG